jgi:hypothetical protein
MKSHFSFFSLLALGLINPISAHAEDWSYTGFYPYVYLYSSDSWIYMPDCTPLVYDFSKNGWALTGMQQSDHLQC